MSRRYRSLVVVCTWVLLAMGLFWLVVGRTALVRVGSIFMLVACLLGITALVIDKRRRRRFSDKA